MKSQLWTIEALPTKSYLVVDENLNTIAECPTYAGATKIVTNRAAALAGAAWIFGGTYEGRLRPHMVDVQPVIEAALGTQGHKEKRK